MRLASLLAVTVTAQIVLGHVCLMPTASAREASPGHRSEDEAVPHGQAGEDSAHHEGCDDCEGEGHHEDSNQTGDMPCGGGHCLTDVSPGVMILNQKFLPGAYCVAPNPLSEFTVQPPDAAATPGDGIPYDERLPFVQTTVLRE